MKSISASWKPSAIFWPRTADIRAITDQVLGAFPGGETYRRVGVSACGRLKRVINFVEPAGHYSHVNRQSYFQHADTQKRRYASPRRLVFIATLRAGASWLFFGIALSTRISKIWVFVTASPARTALKKQSTDFRQSTSYFGDRTLAQNVRLPSITGIG
jgi:hypothetical protein